MVDTHTHELYTRYMGSTICSSLIDSKWCSLYNEARRHLVMMHTYIGYIYFDCEAIATTVWVRVKCAEVQSRVFIEKRK